MTSLIQRIWRCSLRVAVGLLIPALVATVPTACAIEAHDTLEVVIESKDLTESSGLAVSHRVPGHFWTHNDSGDSPRLLAINQLGSVTGSLLLEGANAIDWEDMASFIDQGSRRLLIADIGDNQSKRSSVMVYLLDEPDPLRHTRTRSFRTIEIRYPDGPCDCESIAVDVPRRLVWLVAKRIFPNVPLYSLPLPEGDIIASTVGDRQMLTRRGTLPLPMVTGMDVDPRTGDVLLVNYRQLIRYASDRGSSAGAWIARTPEVTELPKLKQVEAVAVDGEGYVWVTSEGTPAKLVRLPQGRSTRAEETP